MFTFPPFKELLKLMHVTWVEKYGQVYRMWRGRDPLINISSPVDVEVRVDPLFILPILYYLLNELINLIAKYWNLFRPF